MKKLFFLLCGLTLCASEVFTIQGKVEEDKIQVPIRYAKVGSVSADVEGKFLLHVKQNESFIVSAPAFVQRECILKKSQNLNEIDITLQRISFSKDEEVTEFLELQEGFFCKKLPERKPPKKDGYKVMKSINLEGLNKMNLKIIK